MNKRLNNAPAMANLGRMYYHGLGVKQDYEKAKNLYEQAIKLNSNESNALRTLGVMYHNGQGVNKIMAKRRNTMNEQ